MSRKLTESIKKVIAGRQLYKCANIPGSNIFKFDCSLWLNNENRGSFDINGFTIYNKVGNKLFYEDENDLYAICHSCKINLKK